MPRWLKITLGVVAGVALVLIVLGSVGRQALLGTKLAFSEKESVYYSGTATETDARSFGEALKIQRYFDGSTPKDVLISKGIGGTTISFVLLPGNGDEPDIVSEFRDLTRAVAPMIGGLPVTLRLLDEHAKTKHEERVK